MSGRRQMPRADRSRSEMFSKSLGASPMPTTAHEALLNVEDRIVTLKCSVTLRLNRKSSDSELLAVKAS